MKPPYDITPRILQLITAISEKIGAVNVLFLDKPSPKLRKQNKIKTIQSSLQIEGNTLSENQVTALMDEKRVIGPEKDVMEVLNAIKVYNELPKFKYNSELAFLKAHEQLMKGLLPVSGKYRQRGVGIIKGTKVTHVAPPPRNVPHLMKDLFAYLKKDDDLVLIKSCVFHYEMEFIHPFADGNGRMGRLWQTLILMSAYPVFEFLPFETLISKTQKAYYKALSLSDQSGKSTLFIEYMLDVILQSLNDLLKFNGRVLNDSDRLNYFIENGLPEFTRKDYMDVFKDLSSATASRDLKKGVQLKLLKRHGEGNLTTYKIIH